MKRIVLTVIFCHLVSQLHVETAARSGSSIDVNKKVKLAKEGALFLKSLAEATRTVAPSMLALVKVAANVAKFLGPVGALLSLGVALIPKEKSAELKAIENGFNHVELRFEDTLEQIKNLKLTASLMQSYRDYDDIQTNLNITYKAWNDFRIKMKNKNYMKLFVDACNNTDTSPLENLKRVEYQIIHRKIGTPMAKLFLEVSKYDLDELKRLFSRVMNDLTKAAFLHLTCSVVVKPNDTYVHKTAALEAQKTIVAVAKTFDYTTKELVRNGHKVQFKEDVMSKLKEWENATNSDFCFRLKKFLFNKFPRQNWTVIVWDKEDDVYSQTTGDNSNIFVSKNHYSRNAFVSWSDTVIHKWTTSLLKSLRQTVEKRINPCSCDHYLKYFYQDLSGLLEDIRDPISVVDSYIVARVFQQNIYSSVGANTIMFRVCYWYIALSLV